MSDECPADCQCEYVCEQPYRRINELEAELTRLRGLIRDNGTPRFNEVCRRAEAAEAELARLRAPVGGEAGEMVKHLTAYAAGTSNEGVTFGWKYAEEAADLITRQAASLREAREAIERIASQNLHAEITDTDPDELDWLYAYEECVKEARAWLAKHQGGDSGE